MTVYAIGDIHGELDLLREAHGFIAADRARNGAKAEAAPLVHLGDLVDRGPDSAGVIAHLIDCMAADARTIVLKGNHDSMFQRFMARDPDLDAPWYLSRSLGGHATLASYGVTAEGTLEAMQDALDRAVPDTHRAFLRALPLSHRADDCFLVHAGIRPGVPLDAQEEDDLIWIRAPFLQDTHEHGALIVHGHTPVERVEHHGNRLAIDTGAVFGGPLSAVVIEGRDIFLLSAEGRHPVDRLA